jgi:hypothetical protein
MGEECLRCANGFAVAVVMTLPPLTKGQGFSYNDTGGAGLMQLRL